MREKRILVYFALLVPSTLIGAAEWEFLAVGRLYYCSDTVPLLDFIPPFVHDVPDDHYIASRFTVYAIWFLFAAITIALPAIAIWLSSRRTVRKVDVP